MPNPATRHALRAAQAFQRGTGPLPSYVRIRMLERKKLIYVYRRLHETTEYPVGAHTITRPTIYAITLMSSGLALLDP